MTRRSFLTSIAFTGLSSEVFGILTPHRRLQRTIVTTPSVAIVSGVFNPMAPGNVWGYWKADTGVTKDGSNLVSAWADQSGNGKNLNQASGTLQPLYSATQINGYGAITFDGVDNYLTSGGYDATFAQPFSLVLICKQIVWTANRQILSGQGGSALWQYDTTPIMMEYSGGGLAVKVSPTIGSWNILTMVFSGTSSLIQLNNNVSVGGANSSHISPMQDLILGSKYDGTNPTNVAVAELIAFKKALTVGEIATMVAGYKDKFAI